MLDKFGIAKCIARELKDGYYVNLGIGIPTLVANYIPEGIEVVLQSENGLLGMGPFPFEGEEDADLINAGKQTITMVRGASIFDSATSFGMIRAGKVDLTVLGAMDLVASARNIIVAMMHTSKDGASKLLTRCTLPITGICCVKKVVTELGMFEITERGFELREIAPGVTFDEIRSKTAGRLVIEGEIPVIAI